MFYFTKFENTHNLLPQELVWPIWIGRGISWFPKSGILDLDAFLYLQPGGNSRLGFLEFFKRLLQDFLMPHLHAFTTDAKTSPLMGPTRVYVPGHQIFGRMDLA
jgi:hypothetical protein